jgi:hypothetical protein
MYAFDIALIGLVAASCLPLLASARRNERRRRGYSMHRAHFDDRDSLARFRRIISR